MSPTSSTTGDDPIRAEVERRLHAALSAALAAPAGAVRRVDSCVRHRVDDTWQRLGRPVTLVRSLIDLMSGAPPQDPSAPIDVETVATAVPAPVSTGEEPVAAAGDAADLPIEEYESLAASHVVARLGGLSLGELRTIRRFEAGNRGRRTILGKIDQLLAPA